jgi:hypothetical protein
MLNNKLLDFFFIKHIKSGLYIDYAWRLIAKTSILNLFVWGGLYVSEKFIIEYLTRFINNNASWQFSSPTLTALSTLQLVSKWLALTIVVTLLL